jgi:hypothetical protein
MFLFQHGWAGGNGQQLRISGTQIPVSVLRAAAGYVGMPLSAARDLLRVPFPVVAIKRVRVEGGNHDGIYVVWEPGLDCPSNTGDRAFMDARCPVVVSSLGWWWKGPVMVSIDWISIIGEASTRCQVNVPTSQNGNFHDVRIGGNC